MSPVIEVRQLHKRYGETVVDEALDLCSSFYRSLPDVSHVIHRGDVVVVTGNSNALSAAGWAAAFGLAAARFSRWE